MTVTYHVQSLGHGAIELHVLHDVGPLSLVGRDDPDLVRPYPALHQLGHHFLYIHRLTPTGVKGDVVSEVCVYVEFYRLLWHNAVSNLVTSTGILTTTSTGRPENTVSTLLCHTCTYYQM